jgi:hypothetical protein
MAEILEELREAGLLETSEAVHLSPRGRLWLRQLEDIETQEVHDAGEAAADLILSTSGLIR